MAITFSISGGADAAKFNIDPATGKLTFKAAPDFEKPGDANKDNVYEVQVKATDAGGASSTQDIKVTVKDVSENLPPQITSVAAIAVNENQTTVLTVTAVDPDAGNGGTPPNPNPNPPITLTPSGSITVGANNQVIEGKEVTGTITIQGKSGVTVRNCWIKHPGGNGILAMQCDGLTIQDCKLINTSATSGQNPNPDEVKCIELDGCTGTTTLTRITVEGGAGVLAHKCGKLTVSFLEGHNIRGYALRGQLIQFDKCTGGILLEDFSCENDPDNSWTEDNVNFYDCSGSILVRRGLLDGNNSPSGVGTMFEGTPGAVVEDVDMLHMGNGCASVYSSGPDSSAGMSKDMTYRRIRSKDNIRGDQGRGKPLSDGVIYTSSPGCVNTRFEQCQHFNMDVSAVSWDDSTMSLRDWREADFTPRAPIRNKFAWE